MNTQIQIGDTVTVRLFSYKSFRHYGGGEIKTTPHFCKATYVAAQEGGQPFICTLNEPCAGFKAGHKIAIEPNHFNII